MNIETDIENSYISRTYKKETCDKIYITIAFRQDEPKRVEFIRIFGSTKTNNCPNSFFEALADTLTFSIRRIRNNFEAQQICKNLRYHKCLACPPNKNHITSCSDAIGQVLEEVLLKENLEENAEQKTL